MARFSSIDQRSLRYSRMFLGVFMPISLFQKPTYFHKFLDFLDLQKKKSTSGRTAEHRSKERQRATGRTCIPRPWTCLASPKRRGPKPSASPMRSRPTPSKRSGRRRGLRRVGRMGRMAKAKGRKGNLDRFGLFLEIVVMASLHLFLKES